MQTTHVRVHPSEESPARSEQLAWKIAASAADPVAVDADVTDMIINRVIDNAAVAAASLTRAPVSAARSQALAHPRSSGGAGATVFGPSVSRRVSPEWAAWANGVAVRELDYHDTFLAAEYSHPGDNIPPIVAVAQHLAAGRGLTGRELVRGIATGYEVQIDLARSISLHKHKIDHVAHLGPSAAAGIGTLLGLDPTRSSRPSARPCTPPPPPGSPARARSPAGRPTRRPSPGRWPSRPWTGPCAARPAPPRSTRGRTV